MLFRRSATTSSTTFCANPSVAIECHVIWDVRLIGLREKIGVLFWGLPELVSPGRYWRPQCPSHQSAPSSWRIPFRSCKASDADNEKKMNSAKAHCTLQMLSEVLDYGREHDLLQRHGVPPHGEEGWSLHHLTLQAFAEQTGFFIHVYALEGPGRKAPYQPNHLRKNNNHAHQTC